MMLVHSFAVSCLFLAAMYGSCSADGGGLCIASYFTLEGWNEILYFGYNSCSAIAIVTCNSGMFIACRLDIIYINAPSYLM